MSELLLLCAHCRARLIPQPDLVLCDYRAVWRGRDVGLTHSEFKVVSLLAGTPGKYHTYRAIYDMLRGVGFHAGFRAAVRGYIKRIRAKFRAVDPDFACIITHSSVGYCWQSLK
jgi:two-component system response regulator ChvI